MSTVPAVPSASVIIMRDVGGVPEFLLVRRNAKIAFHGGAWVFPGGKIDTQDHAGAAPGDELEVARRAGVRELFEEAGLNVNTRNLSAYSHWTTPENQPKRFAAWFFVAEVPADSNVEIDRSEIVDYRWITAAEALSQRASNEITLPPPAFVSLTKLGAYGRSAALLTDVASNAVQRFVPRVVEVEDGRCSLYEEDAGYGSLDLGAAGARHRCVMLKSGWEYVNAY